MKAHFKSSPSSLLLDFPFLVRIIAAWLKGARSRLPELTQDYDLVSRTYDATWSKQMGSHTERLLKTIPIQKKPAVLDIGCGTGFALNWFACHRHPSSLTGLDNSKGMLEKAQHKLKNREVNWIHQDALAALKNFQPGSYDTAICAWSFEYLPKLRVLKQIRRSLKAGGFVAVITNRKGTIGLLERAWLEAMRSKPRAIRSVSDQGLRLVKDAEALEAMMGAAGFRFLEGWNGEKTYTFREARQAVEWGAATGALAGTFQLLDTGDWKAEVATALERLQPTGPYAVTHYYSAGIGLRAD